MVKRFAFLIYGCLAYFLFLGTFLYAIAFVGGFGVPTRLDGDPRAPLGVALAIDLGLLAVFAVQHSVMARPWFKSWLTRFVPSQIERSTYVICASLALQLLFWRWQPLGGVVWRVDGAAGQAALWTGFAFGWGLVLVVTFLINHFDLFGLRQVWLAFRGRPYTRLTFTMPGPYRMVRHPLYLGFLFAFWMTPTMTVTHLLFALVTTAYIVIAIQFEEHDLVAEHGDSYEAYRVSVPMIVPGRVARTAPTTMRHSAGALLLVALASAAATAQDRSGQHLPDVPAGLDVPAGHVPFLVTHAAGTQNYICQSTPGGVAWRLFGPEATLFHVASGSLRQQIATHFLSANPEEGGLNRPTWQHSIDSSRVWGRAVATSIDPAFVRPDAIAWLKVEVVGAAAGPIGGGFLSQATFIQRVNTVGGLPDPSTCTDPSRIGTTVLVPYETDYVFYRAAHSR